MVYIRKKLAYISTMKKHIKLIGNLAISILVVMISILGYNIGEEWIRQSNDLVVAIGATLMVISSLLSASWFWYLFKNFLNFSKLSDPSFYK